MIKFILNKIMNQRKIVVSDPKVNIIYTPTTLVLVDDHKNFLETTRLELSEIAPCSIFDKPTKALSFLKNRSEKNNLSKRLQQFSNIKNINTLHEEIYNPKRFNVISLVIADHAMPGMTGLELFLQLKNNPVRKLLLTGAVSYAQAIKARQDGIIDSFIMKDDIKLVHKLKLAIQALTSQYFSKKTEALLLQDKNNDVTKKLIKLLADKKFVDQFHQIIDEHQIVEYYLLDEYGSFLFLDKKANPFWHMNNGRSPSEFKLEKENILSFEKYMENI